LFTCFMAVQVTWMSFTSDARGLRGDTLIMPETHIVMRFLIFCLTLSLALCLTLLLVLCLNSLMDLTIAHMVLVHERIAFDLEAAAVEIKNLKHKLDHSSRYTILSPLCEACVSLKCKLFHATKENTEF
jgi:hypothetical protein